MRSRRCAVTLIGIATVAISLAAQDGGVATFDTASIKASGGGMRSAQRVFPGRIDFVNTPLRTVIWAAFGITHVSEAIVPDWTLSSRFDIQATFPDGATQAQVPEMLRGLLRERFGLATHVEPRRIDGYELVVAPGGPRIQEVEPVDQLEADFSTAPGPQVAQELALEEISGRTRVMPIPEQRGLRTVTARSLFEFRVLPDGTQRIDATRMSMQELAGVLRVNLGKPVFDRTGLPGVYQFITRFDRLGAPIVMPGREGTALNQEPTGVSTFKSIEDLGLKLQPLRGPVDVLVVDSLTRVPTEN